MEEKRYAVVTGGNKGIGFEICRQLAANGIEVILTARNKSRGLEAVEKLKASGLVNVCFHQLDIKDPNSVSDLVKFIETHFKKLDILINNAGELGIAVTDGKKFRDGGGLYVDLKPCIRDFFDETLKGFVDAIISDDTDSKDLLMPESPSYIRGLYSSKIRTPTNLHSAFSQKSLPTINVEQINDNPIEGYVDSSIW